MEEHSARLGQGPLETDSCRNHMAIGKSKGGTCDGVLE